MREPQQGSRLLLVYQIPHSRCVCVVTRPGVLLRTVAQSYLRRRIVDGANQRPQATFVVAERRLITVSEHVPPDPKAPVVAQREAALDEVHHLRERNRAAAAYEVDVVRKERVRENAEVEPPGHLPEQGEVKLVIARRVKDSSLLVALGGHVVHSSG